MNTKIDFTNFEAELTTLSPIHIGSGNNLSKGSDFFYDDNQIGKVDIKKVYRYINDISLWTNMIEKGEDIYQYLKNQRKINLSDVCYEILPSKPIKGRELHEFIRNRLTREPIIPGSSIKGAISTALLSDKLKVIHKNNIKEILDNFKNYRKYNDKLIKKIVEIKSSNKNLNPQNNIFKYLQISDGQGKIENLEVDTYQTLNLKRENKWYIKTQLTQNKEVFNGNIKFNIRFNNEFWKNKFEVKNIEEFISKINKHTQSILIDDLNDFKEDLNDELIDTTIGNIIVEQLNNIHQEIDKIDKNSFIMRMSAGSGWYYMTGAWFKEITDDDSWDIFKEKIRKKSAYKEFPFPKTRRLTTNYLFPGFVKVTLKKYKAYENSDK